MGKYSDHSTYITNNKEVPSVTTILKLLNKPVLMNWANAMGFKRKSIKNILEESSDIGTSVHQAIEAFLGNKTFIWIDTKFTRKIVVKMYMYNFIMWWEQHKVNPIELEYHTTCDKFGGTIDFYGEIDGKKTVMDFKTSKSTYSSYLLQLSAYVYMLELEGKEVEQVAVLNINKDKFIYNVFPRENLDKYIKLFLLLSDVFIEWYDINIDDGWGKIF